MALEKEASVQSNLDTWRLLVTDTTYSSFLNLSIYNQKPSYSEGCTGGQERKGFLDLAGGLKCADPLCNANASYDLVQAKAELR